MPTEAINQLLVELPASTKRDFKIRIAELDTNMKEVTKVLINTFLKETKTEEGKKKWREMLGK